MFFNTKKRVDKGIELLDKHCPDWHYRINLNELDMEFAENCILGQLFKMYDLGATKLGLNDWEAYKYGFLPLVQVKWNLAEFFPWCTKRLTKIWTKKIIQKRKEEESMFRFLKSIHAFAEREMEKEKH